MEKEKRIPVITGFGVICNLGKGKEEVKKNLYLGRESFGPVSNKGDFGLQNNYKVGLSDIKEPVIREKADYDKSEIMLRLTAKEACLDAGIDFFDFEQMKDRAAISLATSLMGSEHMINYEKDENKDSEWLLYSKAYAMRLAADWRVKGGVYTTSSACASGTAALGVAIDLIKEGECDLVLCGGTDHISEISLNGFELLGTLSKDECKPFDEMRDGINIGEGSAFFVIEEYEHAKGRNAHIYGELRGYGLANDAYHITSPDPDGVGALYSMEQAMMGESRDNVYVNAHGTGTQANDSMEIKAIENSFQGRTVYVSSTKALTGHCLGAAGSIELAFCLFFLEEGRVPRTVHSACDIEKKENITLDFFDDFKVNRILSNSFAFGGNNASVFCVK